MTRIKKVTDSDYYGSERWFENNVHIPGRILYLGSNARYKDDNESLNGMQAEIFIKGLEDLIYRSKDPIKVIMNSPGGSVHDGWAIYDSIVNAPVEVVIDVRGDCMSMATIILQAGTQRIAYPSTKFMVHDSSISLEEMPVRKAKKYVEDAIKDCERFYTLLGARTKKPREFWKNQMSSGDYLFDAKTALGLGFIDKIQQPRVKRKIVRKK